MDFKNIKNWLIGGQEVVKACVGDTVVWVKSRLLKAISGNSLQDGEPTPDAPIEVLSVGERTANLLNPDTTGYSKGIYVSTSTGLEENSSSYYCTDFIPVQAGKSYTHTTTGLTAHWLYNANKEPTTKISVPSTSSTITIPEGCCYMRFNIKNVTLPDRLMCNAGDTLLDFEPYGYKIPVQVDSTTTNIYTKEPLRKVGEYADEITPTGIIRRVIEYQLDGTTTGHKLYSSGTSSGFYRGTLSNLKNYIPNLKSLSSSRSVLMSNQYQYASSGTTPATAFLNNSSGIGQLYITHSDQTLTTVDALNEQLAVDKPVFYFPVEDTLDTDFSWEKDIEVLGGAKITFDTAVQPSGYVLE